MENMILKKKSCHCVTVISEAFYFFEGSKYTDYGNIVYHVFGDFWHPNNASKTVIENRYLKGKSLS